jgi:hypothetical protein
VVQQLNNGRLHVVIGHARLPTADAYSTLSGSSPRGRRHGRLNAGRCSNPKFDDLLKRIEREVDSTKREAMIRDAQIARTTSRSSAASAHRVSLKRYRHESRRRTIGYIRYVTML